MPRVAFISSPRFTDHDTGPGHAERPDRLRAIHRAVREARLIGSPSPFPEFAIDFGSTLARHDGTYLVEIDPLIADEDVIELVHPARMIEQVRRGCARAAVLDHSDTPTCPASYDVARLAVGAALTACAFAMGGRDCRAFAAVRPPGHHAERERSMGFCLFGTVAIAARHLQRAYGVGRVAIVDFDVHHGNGTQDIFYDDPSVLFVSIHQDPRSCYPGSGFASETGDGAGAGTTLNVPMPPGSVDADYERAFHERIVPALDAFAPEVLLISAGFDAHAADPLAQVNLSDEAYTTMTRHLVGVAQRHCEGRIVSLLEGGYNLAALGRCVVRHLIALTR